MKEWEKTVLDNKHEAVNQFLQSKENTGKSKRTLNEYSRILQKFYHEHFPALPATGDIKQSRDLGV